MILKNKKCLITGAGVRIGAKIAKQLSAKGAKIVIHYFNSANSAKELLNEIGGIEQGHFIVKCDLNDIAASKEMIENLDLDILINNASVYNEKPLLDENIINVMDQFQVNFFTPLELMKSFEEKNKTGVIINILDQRILKNSLESGSYSLSQKILKDATTTAALQFAPNLRVNAVAPGPVLPPPWIEGKGMKKELKNIPLKRKVNMNDLMNSISFLIENESITGHILYVDCGQHLI